jgi:hypothetical protein
MVDFYSQGSNVGFVFTGYVPLFILMFLIMSGVLYSQTKVFPIHRIILFLRTYRSLKKLVPSHWRITLIGFFTTSKVSKDCYKVFVKVRSRINKTTWTCDWIEVNSKGIITKSDLSHSMTGYDGNFKSEIIEFNRNKKIKNLGI